MKRLFTLLSLSLCAYVSQAQITFTSTDIATAPWVNVMQKDTQTGTVNFGNRGANQVYDFHTLQNNVPDTLFYETPTSTQTTSMPGATLALTGDHNTYVFAKNQTALFSYVGGQAVYNGTTLLTPFSPADTGYKFTTAYGQNFRGTYGFQVTRPGSDFGQSSIYQVRITNTTSYKDTIDGWGKVITPMGTYDCLREHRIDSSATRLEYKLFSFSSWADVPTSSSLPSNPIITITSTYNYLTKEAHGSVISFTFDDNGNPKTASWSKTPPVPHADFGYTMVTNFNVSFHDSSTGSPLTYYWTFGDGTTSTLNPPPVHHYASMGPKLVCLTVTNASGSDTHCDTITISATTTVPPIANRDTASVVQPGTVTIHALANDVNQNSGSSICISRITGATAGWATISGCSDIVYHPLDSAFTGLDTFTYTVCDVQVPTVCDSALVILRVTQPVIVVQQPVIGYQLTLRDCGFALTDITLHSDSIHYEISYNSFSDPVDTFLSDPVQFTTPANMDGPTYICIRAYYSGGIISRCDTLNIICEGINEISASQYSIYPNPASDRILLDLSHIDQTTMSEMAAVEVYDILGKKLKAMTVKANTEIEVSDLSTGIYLIGLRDAKGNKRVLGKFEVTH